MTLTVNQILSDARRLGLRLRDHDASADGVISLARDVLGEVESMRRYREETEHLNEVARNRPRAQLVLGIQQENRHIRQLQQENKELRAALEEHQNAIELIMSKYRQHMMLLVNTTKLDKNLVNTQKIAMLQEKTEQIVEMAGVMSKSIQIDDDYSAKEQEIRSRLVTENKGLRDILEISRRNGSLANPLVGPRKTSTGCQTDFPPVAANCEHHSHTDGACHSLSTSTCSSHLNTSCSLGALSDNNCTTSPLSMVKTTALTPDYMRPLSASSSASSTTSPTPPTSVIAASPPSTNSSNSNGASASTIEYVHFSDSEDSEDSEITFNTIKRNSSRVNGGGGVDGGVGGINGSAAIPATSDKVTSNGDVEKQCNGDIDNGAAAVTSGGDQGEAEQQEPASVSS